MFSEEDYVVKRENQEIDDEIQIIRSQSPNIKVEDTTRSQSPVVTKQKKLIDLLKEKAEKMNERLNEKSNEKLNEKTEENRSNRLSGNGIPKYKSQTVLTDNDVIRGYLKLEEYLLKNNRKSFGGEEGIDVITSEKTSKEKSIKILKKLFEKKILTSSDSKEFQEDEYYSMRERLFVCKAFQLKADTEEDASHLLLKYK